MFKVFSHDPIPGEMVAICVAKLNYLFISIFCVWRAPRRASHHACSRVLSDEGVPQDLGQLAGSERGVRFVPAQSSNTLLENEERDKKAVTDPSATGARQFKTLFMAFQYKKPWRQYVLPLP